MNTAQLKKKMLIPSEILTKHIIPSALLAPSAHNTQPWKFTITNSRIDIFIDWNRHLPVSDPNLRQLYISIGCTIANIVSAAHHWGHQTHVLYFSEETEKKKLAARISFTQTDTEHSEESTNLLAAIKDRRTNRAMYDKKPLTSKERQTITSDNESLTLIEDEKKISHIAQVSEEGTFRTLSRKDFKEELSHWVRNNWTRQHDGMPGYAMGIPAPISLLSGFMVRVAPIHIQEAPKTKKQVESSSIIAVFSSPSDTPIEWMKAGELLEKTWLQATTIGLAAMPVVASIEAGEDTRTKIKEIIGTSQLPQSILRIGHSNRKLLRASPRRTLAECLQ